ncbi:EF-hand [Cylindrobasidium torrendii FP15055 ss-10]|uniref:EF-hand n=1 Tax=Cylindrobasidium torrendii FP15055 ss-10 TaxID=1314674 RepID=A0A0D7B792_9AGAR|nr:EF-hand [Cylindrobasidium torrendii FP15055 ss-10]
MQYANYASPPPAHGYGAPMRHHSNASHMSHHSSRLGRPQSVAYGGGYQPGPPAAPAGVDPMLWGYFTSVDVDGSGSISVTELQRALVNGDWTQFDLDTVKMLMNIFDVDKSGTISYNEFAGLWKYIQDWQNVFRHFDADRSGSIEGRELADALRSFGYNLSPAIIGLVERKYASEPATGYGPPPGITFDRFVRACVVVKTLTESFQRVDTDRDGWVQLNYEQFMNIVLSAP